MDYKKLTKIVDASSNYSGKSVLRKLRGVDLQLREDLDDQFFYISLISDPSAIVDFGEDALFSVSEADLPDPSLHVIPATPEQQNVYSAVEDKLESYVSNGEWW